MLRGICAALTGGPGPSASPTATTGGTGGTGAATSGGSPMPTILPTGGGDTGTAVGGGPGATPSTGGGEIVLALALIALALLVARLGARRSLLLLVTVALGATLVPRIDAASAAQTGSGCVIAGADASNVAPFTATHPNATDVDPLSDVATSNPDGEPGGLWDQIAAPGGATSTDQVTPSGIWGEAFVDVNDNLIHDEGEAFTDDTVNSLIDPDSTGKYDGVYLGGFGNGRIPRGVFDPVWVRTLYVRDPRPDGQSLALVALDVVGYFSDNNERIFARAQELEPALELDAFVVSHTHDHQGIDMVGLWGPTQTQDGTYPKYERYVEEKIAQSLVAAYRSAVPARFRAGTITNDDRFRSLRGNLETLDGLQSKGTCRTPWFFDEELRAFQLEAIHGHDTIATAINWGMHIESMEDGNRYLSSDNPHTARAELERAFGGVALYLPGAQGSVEVVGDSCTRRWQRDTFDGERFPVDEDGTPLAFQGDGDEYDQPTLARDRSYAMGRVIGSAAVAALRRARWDRDPTLDVLAPRDVYFPGNNMALVALVAIGVIDKQTYSAAEHEPLSTEEVRDRLATNLAPPNGLDFRTTLFAWRLGSASFVTAPGELFPETYYGAAEHNRSLPVGDYVEPNPAALACSARPFAYSDDPEQAGAHTGRPYEPGIRDVQIDRFGARTNFLVGYTPDLLGYIVPGYDFSWYASPVVEGVGVGALYGEAPDPCEASPPDLAFPDVTYGDHYHETNSASSVLAGGVACGIIELLTGDDSRTADEPGCAEYRQFRTGGVAHIGIDPTLVPNEDGPPVGHY